MSTCKCGRKECYETWHNQPTEVLEEQVTLTVPRFAIEHAAYYLELMDGAWTTPYKALAPYLLDPKPDPSTPVTP